MEIGVHLPQIAWDDERVTLERLLAVATAAERLGFGTLNTNDHLVYGRPWFDGPTALTAVLAAAPSVRLMTSVALPVVRGPFALAKTLGAIDILSGGRLEQVSGPAHPRLTTRLSGSRSRNAGLGSTKRSPPSGPCGRSTVRPSSGSSTTRPASTCRRPRPAPRDR